MRAKTSEVLPYIRKTGLYYNIDYINDNIDTLYKYNGKDGKDNLYKFDKSSHLKNLKYKLFIMIKPRYFK
jgi:hypothetical protein